MINPEELLNSIDAAKYLGVTPARIYQLRNKGLIGRELGSGGYWIYTKSELDRVRNMPKIRRGRPRISERTPKKESED